MKISLIQPKHLRGPERIYEPLGLGYIAAYLKQNGYNDIKIYSATFNSDKQIINSAAEADIVGLTALSPMITHAYYLACEIKKINPHSTIILGGFHASALPEAVLQHKYIDIVVRGEGELTFHELVKALDKNKSIRDIDGISYHVNETVIHNKSRRLINNIDNLPKLGSEKL